jgi:hypothetical protein
MPIDALSAVLDMHADPLREAELLDLVRPGAGGAPALPARSGK